MITGITVIMDNKSSQQNHQEFRLRDIVVRAARPDEFPKWDKLMNENHYLGFRQFAGRSLRYVAQYEGQWVAIAGWQAGAFKCAPRDRWVGWKPGCQFRNLHLIGNNTRFLILGKPGEFPNLASYFLSAMTRRLSADWAKRYGHGLLMAESFVDPRHFSGAMYKASNWKFAGMTRGYARSNGCYQKPHGNPKQLYVYPLRRNATEMLRNADALGEEWRAKRAGTRCSDQELKSLYGELSEVCDFRRAQAKRHSVACVLSIYILSLLSGMRGPVAAAQYGRSLSQKELETLGAWYNRNKQKYEPPSKSTMHRVISNLDTQKLQAVLARYCSPRIRFAEAVAIDGKRIRGANRNGDGHYEVVTLVEHGSGIPLGSLDFREEGAETAAVFALLEEVCVEGKVITLDALHTTKKTARTIVQTHGADYVFTVKGNSPLAYQRLSSVDWERDATGSFTEKASKDHGRVEQRSVEVMNAYFRMIDYPHVKQVFRVKRYVKQIKTGRESVEYAYGITSVDAQRASAEQLLAWNRGHWAVETKNHYRRDVTFGEDGCKSRVGFAPANNAVCANIALAVIFQRDFKTAPEAIRHFVLNREAAFEALFSAG